jgi:glycosyltransferase involved in cell wall biosynthesis
VSGVPLSVIVLTRDEEVNIDACLRSVAGWCDQIVVVDSGSTDRTIEICRRYTHEILVNDYVDHASQWHWSIHNAPLRNEWLLALDADNVVSPELRSAIERTLGNGEADVNGYFAAHRHYFRNRPIRGLKSHWLRLVRLPYASVDRTELVDFRFAVEGPTRTLPGEIIESNQKELSIDFWIEKHRKFADRMALEEILRTSQQLPREQRPSLLGNPEQRALWKKQIWYRLPLYFRSYGYFFYRYVLLLGFLDGPNGLVYHTLQALWFRLLVDVKIAELRSRVARGEVTIEALHRQARPELAS